MTSQKKGFLRENLPWIAQTVAILAVGVGVTTQMKSLLGADTATVQAEDTFVWPEVTRAATPDLSVGPVTDDESMTSDVLAALLTTPPSDAPAVEPVPEVVEVAATAVAPEPAPEVAPEPAPVAVFNAPATAAGCVADLRNLARDARVYFPSGGFTGDEAGLAQARLIGLIAQDCPGVTVRVEGHSDASGNPESNLVLSEQRAQAIVDRVATAGIDVSAFEVVAMGDRQPSSVRGDQPSAYYDRRVEFSIVAQNASFTGASIASAPVPACVSQLAEATAATRISYRTGSVTASQSDMAPVFQLAAASAACPEAKLRVVGSFDNSAGSPETPATARMRAIAMMSMLVASGFEAEDIIVAAPSNPALLGNSQGFSNRRVEFDVIYVD